MKPKAMVIGLDAVPLELIERFAGEGALPNMSALMKAGSANRALPCIPAYTPTNWATLATGAWPGTHGAANWDDRAPGDPPGKRLVSTFDSRAITAETIWEAAERRGLTSLVIAYPGSSPSRLKKGLVVAPLSRGLTSTSLAHGRLYSTGQSEGPAAPLELREPAGWKNAPRGRALEARIVLEAGAAPGAVEDGAAPRARKERAAPRTVFHLLLYQPRGQRQPALLICRRKDAAKPLASLRPGRWSPWLFIKTRQGRRPVEASLRFKLLRASMKGPALSLLRSEIHPTDGFTEPAGLSAELIESVGPYFEHPAMDTISPDLYHPTVYEELRYQVDWQVNAAKHLLKTHGWDIFYNHWHFPDNAAHRFLGRMDPASPAYDPARAERCLHSMREVYRVADRLVGGMMKLAGEDTHIVVVADHGDCANRFHTHLSRLLQQAGLAAFAEDPSPQGGPIDWHRTRAYPLGGLQVCVNLEGRDPMGVVPAGQYEAVQEEIIDLLYKWTDPDTGERAVALALKKKDAPLIGFWGDRCGDVVFVYNAGFAWAPPAPGRTVSQATGGANHGPQIPTASTSVSSNLSAFIIAGPRIRAGVRRDENRLGPIRLVDVVPTICHLLDITPPAHSQGCVLYDLLA